MSTDPTTRASEAYEKLEEAIVTLTLSPGQLISESEVSRHVEMGRTPVREAIQRLQRDKLVQVLPRRGIMISEINLADQMTLLETRRVLDRLIHKQAATRLSDEQRRVLRGLKSKMLLAAERDDLEVFMSFDKRYDETIERASRNRFAADAVAPLHAHSRRFWYMYQAEGDLSRSATLHAGIIGAITDGEVGKIRERTDRLVDYLKQFTLEAFSAL